MTRFAWLQARAQTIVSAGLLAVLVVAAWVTGVQLSHLFHNTVAHCTLGCDLSRQHFLSQESFMNRLLNIVARAVPALIGIFWGAPMLARELESGTFRLAWTQSVTRSRWTLTKLGIGAVVTLLLSGALTLTITWWYRVLDPLSSSRYAIFDRRDIAPIGYSLFAFAAGALIGVIIRRTVPAMATTLGVFIFGRVAVSLWVRPHLLTPLSRLQPLSEAHQFGIASANGSAAAVVAQGSGPPNSWTLSSQILTSSGRPATLAERVAFVQHHCPSLAITGPGPSQIHLGPTGHAAAVPTPNGPGRACLDQAARTFRLVVHYLPVDRYWTLQWLEAGVFTALALLCGAGCYWWVSRRTN